MELIDEIKIKQYELILSEDCNLRCTYCFDNYLSDRENKCTIDNIMSIDIIPNLLLFIDSTKSKENINISLFGGEPLLNWEFFTKFVIEAKKRYGNNCSISTVTNGTLLTTEKIDFLKYYDIGVSISLDGIELANICRINKNNENTWNSVINILPEVISKIPNINIKMVVNKENYKYLYDSYKFLIKLIPSVEILFNYHTDWLTDTVLKEIEEVYYKLFIQEKEIPFISLQKFVNKNYICGTDNFCGDAKDTISINPKGELFFCHQFIPKLNDKYSGRLMSYGNIIDGFINKDIYNIFKDRTKFNKWSKIVNCENCDAKSWCKGGCMAEHYNYNNNESFSIKNSNICKYNLMLNNIINLLN